MKQSIVQIEPERARFDDLVLAQAGVKPAVEDKEQILTRAILDQHIALRLGAEIPHSSLRIVSCHLEPVTRVVPDHASGIDAPIKERAQDHGVAVGGGRAMFGQVKIVKVLHVPRRDMNGRQLSDVPRERFQDEPATVRAGSRELPIPAFVRDKSLNLGVKRLGRNKRRMHANLRRAFPRFFELRGLKADKLADTVSLEVQPVNRTPKINASRDRILHGSECNVSTVTLCKRIISHIPAICVFHVERVRRIERPTSSLATKRSVEGIVTHSASHWRKNES